MTTETTDEPVPKLPRGRGLKFSGPEMFRIVLTIAMLVAVIALTKPCANAVSTFVMGFDGSGSAKGSGSAGSGSAIPDPYEHLTPGMSDEEVKAAIERAKAKNAAGSAAAGSAAAGSAVAPRGSAAIAPGTEVPSPGSLPTPPHGTGRASAAPNPTTPSRGAGSAALPAATNPTTPNPTTPPHSGAPTTQPGPGSPPAGGIAPIRATVAPSGSAPSTP